MTPALLVLKVLLVASADPLEAAREAAKKLEFAQARTALEQVATVEGLSASQVAEYYELRGLVFGSLGDKAKARAAFLTRLLIDPTFRLKGKVSPKVSTPYFEAKADAEERGGITVKLEPGAAAKARVLLGGGWSGVVKQLAVTAKDDKGERRTRHPAAAEVVIDCAAQCAVAVEALAERDWQVVAVPASQVSTVPNTPAQPPTQPVAKDVSPVAPPPVATPQPAPTLTAPTPAPTPSRPRLTGLVVAFRAWVRRLGLRAQLFGGSVKHVRSAGYLFESAGPATHMSR